MLLKSRVGSIGERRRYEHHRRRFAVDPISIDLLRAQVEAKLLAHHTGKEAADRMLLPTGRFRNCRNGHAGRRSKHCKHTGLL
jgi:hypothetical protein